jgi:hypothetical protein
MANTFTLIQTVDVTAVAGQASIDFTSIPQTYTDLLFVVSGRATTDNPTVYTYFNNDTTAANYSFRLLGGDGASSSGATTSQAWFMRIAPSSATASSFSNGMMYIPNYAGSRIKHVSVDSVTENNGATAYLALHAGIWNSTAAITSIKLDPFGTDFAQFSSASLYGIKNS